MVVVFRDKPPNRYALAWDLFPTSRFRFTKDLEKISEELLLYINNYCKTTIIWYGMQESNPHS
jgi:hypothetical protein